MKNFDQDQSRVGQKDIFIDKNTYIFFCINISLWSFTFQEVSSKGSENKKRLIFFFWGGDIISDQKSGHSASLTRDTKA